MNLSAQLPPTMCCLLCFTPGSLERRTDKKGRYYYTCALCHGRFFIHNNVQTFGMIFWSRALADGALVQAARADLERVLGQGGLPVSAVRTRDLDMPMPVRPAIDACVLDETRGGPTS